MAHAQKPDFVFPRNGRVHSNRWGRQFSRLLAAEVCASAWVMLDRPRSVVAWEYWLPTPFASFPFTSPPVRHRVPPGSERGIPYIWGFRKQWSQNLACMPQQELGRSNTKVTRFYGKRRYLLKPKATTPKAGLGYRHVRRAIRRNYYVTWFLQA